MNPLPEYLPSNLTAEETLRALEPCFPPLLMGHVALLTVGAADELQWAQEDMETAQEEAGKAEKRVEELADMFEALRRMVRELEDKWDAAKDLIPKTRQHRPEVESLEAHLAQMIEEFNK